MKILISGGTGFIGQALCASLRDNHEVTLLSRTPENVFGLRAVRQLDELDEREYFDAVINLAGEPIADHRWSTKQKEKIRQSRLGVTKQLVDFILSSQIKPRVFISGSAIGYYGEGVSNQEVDESDGGDTSFASLLCRAWESATEEVNADGVRTCLLRTGIVLGENGGALKKMRLPFKLGLGGRIGSGKQWMPWIHISDMVAAILFCLENTSVQGAVNCTAPQPVTNREFTQALAKAVRRPAIVPMPAVVVRLLMGQMGQELLLSGKHIVPRKLMNAGFRFQVQSVFDALVRST